MDFGRNPDTKSLYSIYHCMKRRCYNPLDRAYKNYGGRGIYVCDKWLKSFMAFFSDMGLRPEGATLERIDNNKGYSPDNCRWATRFDQTRNMRRNRMISFSGETKCITDWAKEMNISVTAIQYRLKAGWPLQKTLTTPSARPRS